MNDLPWFHYSKKFASRIERPCCGGHLSEKDALERNCFLAIGTSGQIATGNQALLWFYVDNTGGTIQDARFQAYGDSAFLGALETICEVAVGKTYVEASRLTLSDIDIHVRDKKDIEAFPKCVVGHITLALHALQDAMEECTHIPVFTSSSQEKKTPSLWPEWEQLPLEEQKRAIEQVLSEEVRPMIMRDSGGVNLIALNGKEVTIAYTGACVSCGASTGSTLLYIQNALRSRIHPEIVVVPKV